MVSIATEVAEEMNNFFIDVIENLDIEHFAEESTNEMIPHDSIENIVKQYSKHPSIIKLKDYVTIEETFSFKNITSNELEYEIKALNPKKASVKYDIPMKMLIETNDISSVFLTKIYQVSKDNLIFPETLKNGDVVLIHKKEVKPRKEIYRLTSHSLMLFERDMYKQMLAYIEKDLSPYLFGFSKGHSTEQCLNMMIERALDKKKHVGAVLTDLSKPFDCINHK